MPAVHQATDRTELNCAVTSHGEQGFATSS